MMRKAGHGDGVFGLVAAGQGEAQEAGGGAGVVEKELVEIAHAEEQERIGTGRFGVLILAHHGSFDHEGDVSKASAQRPAGRAAR